MRTLKECIGTENTVLYYVMENDHQIGRIATPWKIIEKYPDLIQKVVDEYESVNNWYFPFDETYVIRVQKENDCVQISKSFGYILL